MNVLGLETSCDETAASVVRNGTTVLSNIIASSLKEHSAYGGVIPEIASRRQLEFINAVTDRSLKKAGLGLKNIDGIAVTGRPGLIGSLLVGLSFARSLSFAAGKPLMTVDHIKAHAYANFLKFPASEKKKVSRPAAKAKLPAVALIVSGGHTSLYYVKSFEEFRLLGQTLDDAAGEAFDKVAKILDLGYPGGPAIEQLAHKGRRTSIRFQSAALTGTHNFSFSGIKTAVLYHVRDRKNKKEKNFPAADVAYAFQDSVVSILTKKSLTACRKFKTKTLLIGGGVAANRALRERMTCEAKEHDIQVHFPPLSVCMDNAAMIAGLGFHHLRQRKNTHA